MYFDSLALIEFWEAIYMFKILLACMLTAVLWPVEAMAWDGSLTGRISSMHMVSGQPGNFEMRISIDSGNVCSGVGKDGYGWLYLNESDSNYKATVAFLMTAYQTQQLVTVYGNLDSNKFCKLGYSQVSR